jgi:hypothetical protein
MTQTPTLHPLYHPLSQRCSRCQCCKVASAVQILPRLPNRYRYFCIDCAEIKGSPPTQELIRRLEQIQRDHTKTPAQLEQKQMQAKAGGGGK